MIRITLVVGAGKGNRSKYDPAALKLVTTSLSATGYVEDRGASCVVESAGCFKFQHDTGKNLKTVVVFPKITDGKGSNSTMSLPPSSSSLLPPDSLQFKIAVSTLPLFTNMLKSKFPSWSQKRSLLKLIDETLVGPLDKLDARLIRGGLLSEDESMFYEQCLSVSSPLKHHVTLGKLWKQAAPLMYLNAVGGKLLSPAETKKRCQLEDILCEIVKLEESSRGLLEDNESYEERIQSYRRDLQQKYGKFSVEKGSKKKKHTVGDGASSSNSKNNAWNSTTKFQVPNVGGKGGGGWMSSKMKKPKSRSGNKGDVFSALMADSDSDEDEDEEEGPDNRVDTSLGLDTSLAPNGKSSTVGAINRGGSKKRKKKKNKLKTRGDKNCQGDDDVVLDAAVAANNAVSKKETKTKEDRESDTGFDIFSFILSAITEWMVPFILAIFVWLAAFLFGKNKKKKKKA